MRCLRPHILAGCSCPSATRPQRHSGPDTDILFGQSQTYLLALLNSYRETAVVRVRMALASVVVR